VYSLKQQEDSVLKMQRWVANKRYYQYKKLSEKLNAIVEAK
jgi:hypothetical protein